ncbi:DNA/RNA helicase domain-containing protein [Sphingomonas changnyeongensis]|uniref:DNA/RNA helicase domain-containing protein n=1 Tax=Sphingomonas changnyeongensis TaxID=2698679 RepID=UPI001E44509F|nr:DNA/RNA helicase domain-containing protein [Sphingomonas changnyeongensis]
MNDAYFSSSISDFLNKSTTEILGELTQAHHHALEHQQRNAWLAQIELLRGELNGLLDGHIFFEFSIPRMGKRADVVMLVGGMVFVIEFKVGSATFDSCAIDQVHDYALDLKNFHLGSHTLPIVPVLCATEALNHEISRFEWAEDRVASPVLTGRCGIRQVLDLALQEHTAHLIDVMGWRTSGYRPTPTIIEAAESLYRNHSVEDISRSDAGAKNLNSTSEKVANIIDHAKKKGRKSICFITGVPGAGKTLAGLNIAAKRAQGHQDEHAVFLSGNGPLVDVLREALARDQAARDGVKKSDANRAVKRFIQNIHHFRDYYLERDEPPFEKVVVFDEAQRAWTKEQTSKFMQTKRGYLGFTMSEPEFLISVMNRNQGWCTIICLIGGGQEINTGEAGLFEWLTSLRERFLDWDIHASSLLDDSHYTVDQKTAAMLAAPNIQNTQSSTWQSLCAHSEQSSSRHSSGML